MITQVAMLSLCAMDILVWLSLCSCSGCPSHLHNIFEGALSVLRVALRKTDCAISMRRDGTMLVPPEEGGKGQGDMKGKPESPRG